MGKRIKIASALVVAAALVAAPSAYAALTDTTNLTQEITAGTLATFIGSDDTTEVASPNVDFSSVAVSTNQQTSTGTFGSASERIYVDNPGGANSGWTLALAATGGPTATWTNGSDTYPYNAAAAADGQLTLDPSVGSITATAGTTTGISLGTSDTYDGGTSSILLMSAAAGSDDIHRVYLTGVDLSQVIPANTPAGTYTLDFTQTVTAL